MSYKNPKNIVVYTLTGIDGKTTGSTTIFTTEAAGRFIPLAINFEVSSTTGFVVVPSASVGTNGESYNNLLAITALTNMSSDNTMITFPLSVVLSSVAPSTAVRVNITTGATATTYVLKCTIIGWYQ